MGYKKTRPQFIPALALGAGGGFLVTLILGAVAATLISSETVSVGSEGIWAMLAILLGSVTSSLIAAGKTQNMRLPVCAASGALYFVGLLCCGALLFDGVRGGGGVSLLVVMSGAIVVAFLGNGGKKRIKIKVPSVR